MLKEILVHRGAGGVEILVLGVYGTRKGEARFDSGVKSGYDSDPRIQFDLGDDSFQPWWDTVH